METKRGKNPMSNVARKNTYGSIARRGGAAGTVRATEFPPAAQRAQLVALFKARRHGVLAAQLRALLARAPDCGFAWKVLGATLRAQGKSALPALQRAAEMLPDDAEVHNNLGNALKQIGQTAGAVASFRCAVAVDPGFALAHSSLGNALHRLGQFDAAAASCRRAIALDPGLALAHNNLGNALAGLGQWAQALECHARALALEPDNANFHSNLGAAMGGCGQWGQAVASFQRALTLAPAHAPYHFNLGRALEAGGQLAAAAACFRRALDLDPNSLDAHSNLLFVMLHQEDCPGPALLAEHIRYGAKLDRTPARHAVPDGRACDAGLGFEPDPDPERPLRLGFVSGDLRRHPVSYFMLPVWQGLDRRHFSVVAYSNVGPGLSDGWSAKMRAACDQWRDVALWDDATLAAAIRQDRIDILIDLSGHTAHNRLPLFALKPAPLQASWLGYPGTTGLAEMDYLLANRHSAPRGMLDAQFVEKLLTLPTPIPLAPPDDAPPVGPLPALASGRVTFGSFNRISKLGARCLALWAKVLLAVPDSLLLLGNVDDEDSARRLRVEFAALGVMEDRLRLHPSMPMRDYLALHHGIDIVLDSFPYNGGTTTRLALWMGVPVLSLAGNCLQQRQCVGTLKALGLDAWCVEDEAAYLAQAQRAASDLTGLAALRAGLRQSVARAPQFRPEAVARGVERALRHVWRRRCAGLPPEAFEVGDTEQPT